MAQKLIKIGMPPNASMEMGFPSLSKRVVDMGGAVCRKGSVSVHPILGQSSAAERPFTAVKICRLDKNAVFG